MLKKLWKAFITSPEEAYLARATDIIDLERRLKKLSKSGYQF